MINLSRPKLKTDNNSNNYKALYTFWLEAFIAIAILAIMGITTLLIFDAQNATIATDQSLELKVNLLAQRFSQSLNLYHGILQGLAADATLPTLIIKDDKKAITNREKILEKTIPGALRVRLLKPGHDVPDLKSEPPLSYGSIKLLRTAELDVYPPPIELHLAGKKIYLIGVTGLRDGSGQVQGLLHLVLSATALQDEVNALSTAGNQVALQQQVDKEQVTIFGFSDTTFPPDGIRAIAASQLRFAYWYGAAIAMPLLQTGLIVIVGFILAVILVLWLQHWRLRAIVLDDQATLVEMLEHAFDSRINKLHAVTLQELEHLMHALTKHVKELRSLLKKIPVTAKQSTDDVELPDNAELEMTQISKQPTAVETESSNKETSVSAPAKVVKIASKPQTAVVAQADLARPVTQVSPPNISLPKTLFRACDIRGVVGNNAINTEVAHALGQAIGSLLQDRGKQTVSVAYDVRPSGKDIAQALIMGLVASGRDVIELGMAPTPLLYFATKFLDSDSGIMVSAGRFPVDYNGFKIVIDGEQIIGQELLNLRQRALEGPLYEGMGTKRSQVLIPDYVQRIVNDINIARPLKVVIDCGSGCAGLVAPELFKTLGCEVIELFCEPDSSYPDHTPDPGRPENLKALQAKVKSTRADIGLAFDGDGDRLGLIDSRGRIIWPDRILMALAEDVLGRNPGGDIIFDVNCSRGVASQVLENGGRPVMWKAGHPALKTKLRDTQALLAGDWGGHIIFQERWYGFDDACYAAARLLEILSVDARTSSELFDAFPDSLSTPEFFLKVQEGEQYSLIESLQGCGDLLNDTRLVTTDGLRAEYEDGWGLVRASNTMAALRFRFEADNEAALGRIQKVYRDLLAAVAPKLKAPF